jgi:hypothetical protein
MNFILRRGKTAKTSNTSGGENGAGSKVTGGKQSQAQVDQYWKKHAKEIIRI